MAAPLVLVPGLICDARIWRAQAAAFPGALAVGGHGEASDLREMANRVLAVAPTVMSLAGHSMGARVALEMVRLAPSRIERLAIIASGTHLPRPGEAESRRALLALGREQGMAALVDAWLPPMIAPARRQDGALVEPLRTMCIDQGIDAFAAQIEALIARPALESLLPQIDCPVLVTTGSEDGWAPPGQHRAIAAAIAGARFVELPGAGHMCPAETPDQLNDVLAEWLAREPQSCTTH